MSHEQEQRMGVAHDTPSGASETPTPEPDAVVNARRAREGAAIAGMQGAGTSAGGESPTHATEPGGGAPTVSGASAFDAEGHAEVPEHPGGGKPRADRRPGPGFVRDESSAR